jgi:hypothetical protein
MEVKHASSITALLPFPIPLVFSRHPTTRIFSLKLPNNTIYLLPDCPSPSRLLKILNLLYSICRGKISRKYKKSRGKFAGGFAIDPAVVQTLKKS